MSGKEGMGVRVRMSVVIVSVSVTRVEFLSLASQV